MKIISNIFLLIIFIGMISINVSGQEESVAPSHELNIIQLNNISMDVIWIENLSLIISKIDSHEDFLKLVEIYHKFSYVEKHSYFGIKLKDIIDRYKVIGMSDSILFELNTLKNQLDSVAKKQDIGN